MHADENRNLSYLSHAILIIVLLFIICMPVSSLARMDEISEDELSQISAQSGINYVIGDSQFRIVMDSYRISDTDHSPVHWMEFNNVTIDDGQGGYFSLDTPANLEDMNTFDIGTDDDGRTLVFMNQSYFVEPRTYTVGNFVFCDQDLGSIRVEDLTHGPSDTLIVGSHSGGGCGIDMEYQTQIDIESFEYTFNTQSDAIVFNGIHLSQYASGSPEDPTSWDCLGKFKLGDLENDNPMTIDIGTTEDSVTSLFINIPMTGTARIEGVGFAGNDFGPCAVDGINVHYLGIQIPGN